MFTCLNDCCATTVRLHSFTYCLTARNWSHRFEHNFGPETVLESFRLVFRPARYIPAMVRPTGQHTKSALSPKSKPLRILYDDFEIDAVRCGDEVTQLVEALR